MLHGPPDGRLAELERRMIDLERQLGVVPVRAARTIQRPQLRPALTAIQPAHGYDSQAPWIKFLKPDLTTNRQANALAALTKIYPDPIFAGTKIEVWEFRGLWLTDYRQPVRRGKPTANIAKGASGNVDIYDSAGSVLTTVSAISRLGSVTSATWVYLAWVEATWDIFATEC